MLSGQVYFTSTPFGENVEYGAVHHANSKEPTSIALPLIRSHQQIEAAPVLQVGMGD